MQRHRRVAVSVGAAGGEERSAAPEDPPAGLHEADARRRSGGADEVVERTSSSDENEERNCEAPAKIPRCRAHTDSVWKVRFASVTVTTTRRLLPILVAPAIAVEAGWTVAAPTPCPIS